MDLDAVGDAMRHAHDETVAPHFGSLVAEDLEHKAAGELVTVADRACERLLGELLRDIIDAPVLGEESASADPALLDAAMAADAAWLVDPIDGTSNFVAGRPDYAVMVAFLSRRRPVASWILQPQPDRLAIAERGAGATIDGRPVETPEPLADPSSWSGVIKDRFLPDAARARVDDGSRLLGERHDTSSCAGFEYPALVAGRHTYLLYWRTLPWDHAPGVLLAEEAGCRALRPDGAQYEADDGRNGLVVAHRSIASAVATRLLGKRDPGDPDPT